MQRFKGPDGNDYDFPDGMAADDIKGVFRKKFGGPEQAEQPSVAGDVAKSAGVGLVKGGLGLAGSLGDLEGLAVAGYDKLTGNERKEPYLPGFPTSEFLQHKLEEYTGPLRAPETTAGQYAETVGSFLPALAAGPVGAGKKVAKELAERLVTRAVVPGVASEAAGQATEGTAAEPYARLAGALAGGIAPGIARRAVTPFPASPALKAQTEILAKEGVPLTAGQKTGNSFLKATESQLRPSMYDPQKEAFTRSALKRIGVDSDRATPEIMSQAYRDIGDRFNSLAGKYDVPIDQTLKTDLAETLKTYKSTIEGGSKIDLIGDTVSKLSKLKTLSGESYKNLRSELGKAVQSTSSGANKSAINEIIHSLDDAMENTIKGINPDDVGKWQEARKLYKNYLIVERSLVKQGEGPALDVITPNNLAEATRNVGGKRAYVHGNGDFNKLVRAGQAAMRGVSDSGTASRLGPILDIGGASALFSGLSTGNLPMALTGGAALARRAIPYQPMQGYVGNQLLKASGKTAKDRLLDALLAGGQGSLPLRMGDD